MGDFFNRNKIPLSIIAAALIISGSIWLSRKPASVNQPQSKIEPSRQQLAGTVKPAKQSSVYIDYTQAPDHVGEYVCLTGVVDHVYTSGKGTIFINFCSDYKNCPFGAVIFASDADKFSNPVKYEGKTVEITGLVRSYRGQAEIIINDTAQIKVK